MATSSRDGSGLQSPGVGGAFADMEGGEGKDPGGRKEAGSKQGEVEGGGKAVHRLLTLGNQGTK